jgi:hypothetical protein
LTGWRIATRLAVIAEAHTNKGDGKGLIHKPTANVAPLIPFDAPSDQKNSAGRLGIGCDAPPVDREKKAQKSRDMPGFVLSRPLSRRSEGDQPKFFSAKSQFTRLVRKTSTNLGRALR